MKGLLMLQFFCFLMASYLVNCKREGESGVVGETSESRTTDSIPWSDYCGCLEWVTTAVSPKEKADTAKCFRRFYKKYEVKKILRKFRNRREVCMNPSKDGDEECKIVRSRVLLSLLRQDLNSIDRKYSIKMEAVGPRVVLFLFWRVHPDLYAVCKKGKKLPPMESMIQRFSKITLEKLKQGVTEVNYMAAVIGDEPLGHNLVAEVFKLCYQHQPSSGNNQYIVNKNNFCYLDLAQRLIRKMKIIHTEANTAGKWSEGKQRNLFNAFRLNFVAMKEQYLTPFKEGQYKLTTSVIEDHNGYKNNINTIIQLVDSGEIEQLKLLTLLLPNDILTCSGSHVQTEEACYFKKILDQLVTHFKVSGIRLNGRKRIKLSTSSDYGKLLEFRQVNRILRVVHRNQFTTIDLAESITDINNQRFTELKNYFVQLQRFNENKATADIGFIDGWLNKYRPGVTSLANANGNDLKDLLIALVTGVSLDVAEKAARMALAIAEACNPLKALFGGTSLSDIADATAQFASAMTNIALAANLQAQLKTLIEKSVDLGRRFDNNGAYIKTVLDLIKATGDADSVKFEMQKRKFIKMYTSYSPKVKRPELVGMEEYWIGVVTLACDAIDGIDSTLGSTAVAYVKSQGLCWKLPKNIKEMMATYGEIYDFQFDLVETLANSMRAKIGKREANNIAKQFQSFPERVSDKTRMYRSIYTLSYLTYNIQTWNTIETYCDKLEYAEGGVRPTECKGEKTDLPSLMVRTKQICTGDTDVTVRIPIRSSGSQDTATLNMASLYKGHAVSFQIQSRKWLIDNKWLLESEAKKAIYIKNFELFLPTVTEESVTYISKSIATGENALNPCDDCKQYILPNQERESKFKEGYDAICSDTKKIPNPYTLCRKNKLPAICRLTTRLQPSVGMMYPSIFARWKFTIEGYKNTPLPDPGNADMYIKAKITYCSLDGPTTTGIKRSGRSRKCCDGNNYFSVLTNECTPCPEGKPNLKGYYCEKNKEALIVDE